MFGLGVQGFMDKSSTAQFSDLRLKCKKFELWVKRLDQSLGLRIRGLGQPVWDSGFWPILRAK